MFRLILGLLLAVFGCWASELQESFDIPEHLIGIRSEDIPHLLPLPSRSSRARRQAYSHGPDGSGVLVAHGEPLLESGPWRPWQGESECSRTCGGGVKKETRTCGGSGCKGPPTRYVSCNTDDCPEDTPDFRSEQCSNHDSTALGGTYYSWVPYFKEDDKCALNCMPKQLVGADQSTKWFYTHEQKVVDGTKCEESLNDDICVDGVCLPLGCDGTLGSATGEDKCRVCGGDGSTCTTKDGIYSEIPDDGYNNVVTIPAGATAIKIAELYPSKAYVAIRNMSDYYYLNGEFKFSFAGNYKIAGTVFNYERKNQAESLSARGPLSEDLVIQAIHQGVQPERVKITFEYSVPVDQTLEYELLPDAWTPCSVQCGKGNQTRELRCVRREDKSPAAEEHCTNSSAPAASRECETEDCEASWFTSDWEECSLSCGDTGHQYRTVYCHIVKANGMTHTVDDDECSGDRPAVIQECNRFDCPVFHEGPWSVCSKECGDATQFRSVSCQSQKPEDNAKIMADSSCGTQEKPEAQRPCNLGPCEGLRFVTTEWKLCSKCNDTTETRNLTCQDESSRPFPLEKCDEVLDGEERPETSRDCATPKPCVYQWHASQWSECSTKCGKGDKKRRVFCAIEENGSLLKMDEMHCDANLRPEEKEECTNEEECTGTYYSGPWKECSATCDGGTQTRDVHCFDYQFNLDPTACDNSKLPTLQQECNTDPCDLCAASEFGCCPNDNTTLATGPYLEGCSDCPTSEFGCCADNVTAATGPEKQGCGDDELEDGSGEEPSCDTTEFGCCEDGVTAAEGADLAGCPEPMCNYTSDDGVELQMPCADVTTPVTEIPDALNETMANTTTAEPMCEDSENGCCPDWYSFAEGPDNAGCPEIITGQCNDTKHGCCPDEVTLSRGPDMQGCGESDCAASLYGCCKDRQSIAFGPHYEGCERSSVPCEKSTFGCCPDGETTALGQDGEGCAADCLVSLYGCCPDNKKVAKGPNYEGCGCQYSQYGCCPDGSSSATGPGNAGCPQTCAQRTYGCCPDGKTEQRGPDREGCPCRYQRYGCCPDGETAARGPNHLGCDDCHISPYGCCPDGLKKASGPRQDGCYEPEPEPTGGGQRPGLATRERVLACSLTKDQGQLCTEYKLFWHYDTESQKCNQFWFAGCEGNDNRFGSKEECESVCVNPSGDLVCFLPKVSSAGDIACNGDYQLRFFWDNNKGSCEQFWFKCTGNGNNFMSQQECTQRCGHHGRSPAQPDRHTHQTRSDRPQRCLAPADPGPCQAYFSMYTFNTLTGRCERFMYGGCDGNENRFHSLEECQITCNRHRSAAISPQETAREVEVENTVEEPHQRPQPAEERPFTSMPSIVEPQSIENDVEEVPASGAVCRLPAAPGHCGDMVPMWYYDLALGACTTFIYSGCAGNDNRFVDRLDCEATCSVQSVRRVSETAQTATDQADCSQPNDIGQCNNYKQYWFYNSSDGTCKTFFYGGCGGNTNRFDTMESCEQTCATTTDICTLPPVKGPCYQSVEMFHYDPVTQNCMPFIYGGCMGNYNRFVTVDLCMDVCGMTVPSRKLAQLRMPPTGTVHEQSPGEYYLFAPTNKTSAENEVYVQPAQYEMPTSLLPELCKRPKDVGTCYGKHLRWFYDWESQMCTSFIFTGCAGNPNRFDSIEECERACGLYRDQDVCLLPKDQGPCLASIHRWHFDATALQCKSFIYGGCEGNGNRFATHAECQDLCTRETGDVQDICQLTPDSGPCASNETRWFYNKDRGVCETFQYAGCEGNLNNFFTKEKCEKRCLLPGLGTESGRCLLPRDSGPCLDPVSMWYYEAEQGACRLFTYGGCRGNENRFSSKHECQAFCKGKRLANIIHNREEICRLGFERGPCSAEQERFYYDPVKMECREFMFGGCLGNKNRFITHSECDEVCRGIGVKVDESEPLSAQIVVPNEKHTFITGEDVLLGCRYVEEDRAVSPAAWFKDGVRMQASQFSDRIQMFSNGSLLLRPSRPSDSGDYSCAPYSTRSRPSPVLYIRVKHPDVSAECQDSDQFEDCDLVLKAKLCHIEYYKKFCCATCSAGKLS